MESELGRLRGRAPEMGEGEFEEVGRTVRRVVDKLLHAPTVRIKELAVTSGVVSYESALQELFNLDPPPGRSVALPASDLPRSDFPEPAGRRAAGREAESTAENNKE